MTKTNSIKQAHEKHKARVAERRDNQKAGIKLNKQLKLVFTCIPEIHSNHITFINT